MKTRLRAIWFNPVWWNHSLPDPIATDVVRAYRYLLRLPLLLLHLLVGLPVVLLCLLPPSRGLMIAGQRLEERAVRTWSSALMWLFGFRVSCIGTPLEGGVLMVANHVSWVDIELIHSQKLVGFVAKAEIASWPLVGWMAARGHTIFHKRGSQQSLGDVVEEMVHRLLQGRPVAVFPEGRTRDGRAVGPFHARIFSAAVEAGVPVQPVALRYGIDGEAQTIVAFGPSESFVANFLRLLGEPSRPVSVHFLEPIDCAQLDGRKQIAELARARVVDALKGS